jgi:hypothetical protein
MEYLFDSRGRHIANRVGDQLHAPGGKNIGHWIPAYEIFIDPHGRYLGEVIDDRLLYRRNSPHRNANYGAYGNSGNVGNYGNPGIRGGVALPYGYEDVRAGW